MGVQNMIRDAKSRFRQMQTNQNVQRAEHLKQLREDRIREEGFMKIKRLEESEKKKLQVARDYNENQSLTKISQGLKKVMNRSSDNPGIQFGGEGIQFGGQTINTGGKGLDVGGGNVFGGFSEKKEIPKPKKDNY